MIRSVSLASLALLCLGSFAAAQVEEDEIVRLPGQGEVRSADLRERTQADRLKPGAGLFLKSMPEFRLPFASLTRMQTAI